MEKNIIINSSNITQIVHYHIEMVTYIPVIKIKNTVNIDLIN